MGVDCFVLAVDSKCSPMSTVSISLVLFFTSWTNFLPEEENKLPSFG